MATKVRRPEVIEIEGFNHTVQYVPGSEWDHMHLGHLNINEQKIKLDDSNPPDSKKDTVLHEVIHAIYKYRIPFEARKALMGENLDAIEEMVVNQVTTGVLMTLRRNPHLVDWLMEID